MRRASRGARVRRPARADFGARLLTSFQLSRSFGTFSLDTVADDAKTRVRAAQCKAAHRQMDDGRVFDRIILTPARA